MFDTLCFLSAWTYHQMSVVTGNDNCLSFWIYHRFAVSLARHYCSVRLLPLRAGMAVAVVAAAPVEAVCLLHCYVVC